MPKKVTNVSMACDEGMLCTELTTCSCDICFPCIELCEHSLVKCLTPNCTAFEVIGGGPESVPVYPSDYVLDAAVPVKNHSVAGPKSDHACVDGDSVYHALDPSAWIGDGIAHATEIKGC